MLSTTSPPPAQPIDITVPRRGDLPHRLQLAMLEAESIARADGEQVGYLHGWRHGLVIGAVVGAALASLGWSVYLVLAAPEVAPPSARPVVMVMGQR